MEIGLIADIHGNLQALQAVLAALEAADVALILCAGDVVCYGAQPNEVIALLRKRGIPCVAGNYDTAVAWNVPAARQPSTPLNEPLKQAALNWTKQQILPEQRVYLCGLPFTAVYEIAGRRIRLLHAGPRYLDEWVTPDDPRSLADVAAQMPADVIVLGHTHQPFVAHCGDTLFINPGAVGRSLDGDPRASYAVLDLETRLVQHHRLAYDLDTAVTAIQHTTMPPEIARLIAHAARRIEDLQEVMG